MVTMVKTMNGSAGVATTTPRTQTPSSGDPIPRRSSSHRSTRSRKIGNTGPKISWKADPEASFSDWTIKVIHDEDMDIYHIHRNIVGYGQRKSEYLLREFRDKMKEIDYENNGNITHLQLPMKQAQVVPMVLDFLYYTKEAKQTLTAERACSVFKIAELLEIQALQKAIADFYTKNLSLKNLGEFLMAASHARADRLLVVSKAKIGQMITEKPELSGLVPPKFLADILLISRQQLDDARAREPEKYSEHLVKSQSRYWSKAACICAVQNESILTRNLFDELTSEVSLPFIDSSVAPKLLSMDAKFSQRENGVTTSLQKRCIDSITDDFPTFQKGFSSPQACSETLKELPSHVLAEILMRSMNR